MSVSWREKTTPLPPRGKKEKTGKGWLLASVSLASTSTTQVSHEHPINRRADQP